MKLVDALRQHDTVTENGMATNSSSLNSCVDLFFNIGAMRGQDKQRLLSSFSLAFAEDPMRAMKILFWARDVRKGAGERQIFRDIVKYLADARPDAMKKNLVHIAEFGRFDDYLEFIGTRLEKDSLDIIQKSIFEDGNGLCAKWMPRKGKVAAKLRSHMGLSPKMYRKSLVALTRVVETQMCSNEWEKIEYGKVPSLASSRYQKAFGKHDPNGYAKYIESLQKGEAKINAGAVYPYDITKSLSRGNSNVAIEQWKALPNYLEGSTEMILPMVDVSGSMNTPAGGNPNVTCMDVAISLGLYISERSEGPFKDAFLTFSSSPELQILKGNLLERHMQLRRSEWGMNTNLEAAFNKVLDQAIKHKVSQEQMPDKILILSDMQFDEATNSHKGWYKSKDFSGWNPTAQQMIEKMYADAGYEMPKIVYWNLQSRNGDVPVSFDKSGTALISGFSPAIMTSILGAEEFTPVSIMDKTIMSTRYKEIVA